MTTQFQPAISGQTRAASQHDQLMRITERMPMKTIEVNERPYLERYFAGYTDDGGQWWYHRFLCADAERHLHTHPWTGTAVLLCGSYKEHLRPPGTDGALDRFRYFSVGHVNQIFPNTLHRIVEVQPNTWTMLHIKPGREPTWKFIADDGTETVMQASPENWHESAGARGCD